MIDIGELEGSIRAIIKDEISNLWKIRIGKFIKYSVDDQVSNRRADIILYDIARTEIPQPQTLEDVPIIYFGAQLSQEDFSLTPGDEMLVLFCDRSTDAWRRIAGSVPSLLLREDQHSVDFAVALPIVGIHQPLTKATLGVHEKKLQPGQKLQIGIQSAPAVYAIEIIQEMYTVFKAMSTIPTIDGDSFAAAFATFQTTTLAPLITKLQTLGVVV